MSLASPAPAREIRVVGGRPRNPCADGRAASSMIVEAP